MFSFHRIRGESMEPTLQSGDIVLLRRREAKPNDVLLVEHPDYGRIIKRLGGDGFLIGDGAASTSRAALGRFDPATLIGVAVLIITPAGLRRP